MALFRGKWLENVDQTHLVLASVKPVLQKRLETQTFLQTQIPIALGAKWKWEDTFACPSSRAHLRYAVN